MAAPAILNLLFLSILVTQSNSKISLIYANRWLNYYCLCAKIQDGGRQHLGFYFCLIFWHTCM